jgi:predicted ATP-binding protein involved in virulence
MPGIISRFRIESLHNLRNIDVTIKNNKLVLVGENGTGKSTVANLIYFFLTRQWHKMLNYEFKRIIATINENELTIERDDISKIDPKSFSGRFPVRAVREVENIVREIQLDELLTDRERTRQLALRAGVSSSMMSDIILQILETQPHSDNLREIEKSISGVFKDQVLYLPTYRRIEQDLKAIFPQMDLDEFRVQSRNRLARRADRAGFIELVEFGMEDVEFTIERRLEEIKDYVRTSLSNLTGTYLRDVINAAYQSADLLSKLVDIDEQALEQILKRIPPAILTGQEQNKLRDIVHKIKSEGGVAEEDKVIAHFLTQLIDLYKTQQNREADVREFVGICNQYLSGKEMIYDNSGFSLSVSQKTEGKELSRIKLSMLSSGEKQIISLFSHVYLSGQSGYFVVIDEPELSLSVPWQRRFLPDIIASQRCSGLIAVTHSPFIFDNELDIFTHSLEEFVEPIHVVS